MFAVSEFWFEISEREHYRAKQPNSVREHRATAGLQLVVFVDTLG